MTLADDCNITGGFSTAQPPGDVQDAVFDDGYAPLTACDSQWAAATGATHPRRCSAQVVSFQARAAAPLALEVS